MAEPKLDTGDFSDHGTMKPLAPPDSHHLNAAQGWLELGNLEEANAELECITAKLRVHPDVLDIRFHIYAQNKQWDVCLDLAEAILKLDSSRADAWVHRSFALHELGRTQEAFDKLEPVVKQFSKVWTIPYNLACYQAQLGRLEESESWLKKAMAKNAKTIKRMAIDDPDLKPLWDSMSGKLWKRKD